MQRIFLWLLVGGIALWETPVEAYEGSGGLVQLQQFSDGLAELAARVKPGVVAIKTEIVQQYGGEQNPFAGTPFEDFFQQHPFFRTPRGEPRRDGLGSGVIVSPEGYILTNNHVITAPDRQTVADKIVVELNDKRTFEVEVVGRDPKTDLAVLKIEGDDLPTVSYGNSDELRVGEVVVAVGNPFGQLHTVTAGIVSALGRGYVGLADYEDYIQTDAAINPGNSGGALVNARGELVGINTAIVSGSGGYQGIGFAIPANMARNIMDQLIEHGEVKRGLLGVHIQDVTPEMVQAMGLKERRGVLISSVNEDGPADQAGLKRGDIVLEVDGTPTNSTSELRNRIAMTAPGTRVKLKILRDGKEKMFTVKLAELEPEKVAAAGGSGKGDALGFQVQELTAELARQLGYEGEKGVVISGVQPGSAAGRAGLRRGDLVQEVNRQPVHSVGDFRQALEMSQGSEVVLLLVRRGEYTQFVALRLSGK